MQALVLGEVAGCEELRALAARATSELRALGDAQRLSAGWASTIKTLEVTL